MWYTWSVISASLIREARLRAGLSQADLAARAGKPASAIGRWERAEVRPALETVVELVRAAGFELTFSLTPADPHDRVLVRRSLAQTPPERMAELVSAVRTLGDMTAAARRG